MALPDNLPTWAVDLILVAAGIGCVVVGTVQGGRFGDGMVVGGGLTALGAGIRGLVIKS